MSSPHYQLDKHSLTNNSKLGLGKPVAKTNSSSSTEQHLDSRASWVVALAAFSGIFLGVGVPRSFSVFFEPLRDLYDINRSSTLALSLLFSFTCHSLGFATAPLSERVGRRTCLLVGGSLGCICLVMCSFAPSYWLLLVFYSIGLGSALGLVFNPALSGLGHHFHRLLPLASSLVTLSIPLGSLVLPKVFMWLLALFDVQGTLFLSGAFYLHICICGALMLPAPAVAAATPSALPADHMLTTTSIVVHSLTARLDATRDAHTASPQTSKHSNSCIEMSEGSGSKSPAPPLNSNALDDPNLSSIISPSRFCSSTNKMLPDNAASNVPPSDSFNAQPTGTTFTSLNADSKKSNWLCFTFCEYWKMIRVLPFLAFALSVNMSIGSNMMILTPLVSYLSVERGYTTDAATNAFLTLSLGELCGRLMCIVFVTLIPILRARRRSQCSQQTTTTKADASDVEKPTSRISSTTTTQKKLLIRRLLTFSNVFVASFFLNFLILFLYCLLGFLDRDSLVFAPLGYSILMIYGSIFGLIMTLYPIVAAELVGRKKLSTAFGLVSLFGPIFIAGVPFVGGVLRDLVDTWRLHFAIAATQLLFAFLLSLYSTVSFARRRRRARRLTIATSFGIGGSM